jgi:hypothetical protein
MGSGVDDGGGNVVYVALQQAPFPVSWTMMTALWAGLKLAPCRRRYRRGRGELSKCVDGDVMRR